MGELSFVQEYLCRVVDDEAAVFPRGQTRKNLQMERVLGIEKQDDWRYVLGFDPAHGVGQDYSVIVCLAQDPEGYVHFVNMWRRNDFPPDKQVDMLVEWSKRFNAPIAAEDGFQQLYESILIQKGAVVDYRRARRATGR